MLDHIKNCENNKCPWAVANAYYQVIRLLATYYLKKLVFIYTYNTNTQLAQGNHQNGK